MGVNDKQTDFEPTNQSDVSRRMVISSVIKSLGIFEALQTLDDPTISNAAEYLDLSVSTVYKHAHTLKQAGYLVENDGAYRPSLKIFEIWSYLNQDEIEMFKPAREALQKLANTTGENCWLMAEERGKGMMIHNVSGAQALEPGFCKEGKWTQLHYTAAGKAILAHLELGKRKRIIDEIRFDQRTRRTITNRDDLRDQLERIRDRGYALNDEEAQPKIRAIGTPIINETGDVLGAISVSGPTSRLSKEYCETELSEELMEQANIIEIKVLSE